jgi:hypothetical protein
MNSGSRVQRREAGSDRTFRRRSHPPWLARASRAALQFVAVISLGLAGVSASGAETPVSSTASSLNPAADPAVAGSGGLADHNLDQLIQLKVIKNVEFSAGFYNLLNEKFGYAGGSEHRQMVIPQGGPSFRFELA